MTRHVVLLCCGVLLTANMLLADESPALRIASFDVDATPPVGSPVAYARVRSVADPLHAKGVVLLPVGQKPVVICVLDWIGIANGSQDWWRKELAEASGTTASRVTVHTVHQHDGPRCDISAIACFADPQQAAPHFDMTFNRRVLKSVTAAIRKSISTAAPVTHIGIGKAKVDKVASNRRLLGPDGMVAKMRFSSCRDPEAIAAPEGVIDPFLRLVGFWNGDQPLVCLMYYASHPMSYYGQGDVSADFVGLARARREKALGFNHIYFTGAGGNIAAGKYNDGSPAARPILTERMADAMRRAWDSVIKEPVTRAAIQWRVQQVALPIAEHLDASQLRDVLKKDAVGDTQRLAAASNLAWLERCRQGRATELTCLKIGTAYLVHMPGELLVEYQLAASEMRPDDTVCLAAYGDYGPGYIATAIAYTQGPKGYESSPRASRVSPEVETRLLAAMRRLLK